MFEGFFRIIFLVEVRRKTRRREGLRLVGVGNR